MQPNHPVCRRGEFLGSILIRRCRIASYFWHFRPTVYSYSYSYFKHVFLNNLKNGFKKLRLVTRNVRDLKVNAEHTVNCF